MFSLRKKTPRSKEFLEYMVELLNMNRRYAEAFLRAYDIGVSLTYSETLNKYSLSSQDHVLLESTDTDLFALSLVQQAYTAYVVDLRHGKFVGTDVEVAVWAILCSRPDVLESMDKTLAAYLEAHRESRLPTLFRVAFH